MEADLETIRATKEALSNWKEKRLSSGERFDDIFHLEGIPLSWFYRPILYSGLLPPPFPTVQDYCADKPRAVGLSVRGFALQKLLLGLDRAREYAAKRKRSRGKSHIKKILFLAFSNYLNENAIPFREERIIQHLDGYEPFLLGVHPLSSSKITFPSAISTTLYSYYDGPTARKVKQHATKLAWRWNMIHDEEKKNMLLWKNKDLFSFFQPHLDLLYSEQFITLLEKYYYAFSQVLEEEQIVAAVTSSQNNILEKCLIAAAQKKNIPVFIIQHGVALGYIPTIDTPDNVYFEVFGKKYKNDLIHLGVLPENIHVAGPVIFDGLEQFIGKPKQRGVKTILLATSPLVEDHFLKKEEYFFRVKMVLQQINKVQAHKVQAPLVIKLHPREKYRREYERILYELQLPATISAVVGRQEHYALVHSCSLIISFGSTVAFEAMILGRPTLSIKMFDEVNPANQVIMQSEATTIVSYQDDFSDIIAALLQKDPFQKKAQKFIRHLCYQIDGKSSQRIVGNMEKVIEKYSQK